MPVLFGIKGSGHEGPGPFDTLKIGPLYDFACGSSHPPPLTNWPWGTWPLWSRTQLSQWRTVRSSEPRTSAIPSGLVGTDVEG